MKRLFCVCCLALAFVFPNQRLDAATLFYFTSSPSSYIGGGQTLLLTGVSATVTYNLGAYSDSVDFEAGGYGLTIVGPGLTLPVVGSYSNATRWPFQGSAPGMAFTSPGRANNTLTGYFNVLQADYDANGQVVSFAVDFTQYDEGNQSSWNSGSIRYNSDIAIPELTPSVTISSPTGGTIYTNAQTVTIAATVQDSAAVNQVGFDEDGALVGTALAPPYVYDWTFSDSDNGMHQWTALAYDVSNNVATSAVVSVTVSIPMTGCSYAFSASTVRMGATAAAGSVNLIAGAGCAWTAATTADWITIASGGSGSGNGTIDYGVDANTNASARTGTIIVSGQTFTIDQAESSPVSVTIGDLRQTCKTKFDKKTETTNSTCTVEFNLTVSNGGATENGRSEVLLWLEQGSSFDPNSGLPPMLKAVKVLKASKSVTLKFKSQTFTGDQAGTFIFATDTDTNVLAFAEVPGS